MVEQLLAQLDVLSLFHTSPSVWVVRSPTSTRMNGQKNALPLNDTRACMNG